MIEPLRPDTTAVLALAAAAETFTIDRLTRLTRVASVSGTGSRPMLADSAHQVKDLLHETGLFTRVAVVTGTRTDGTAGGPAIIATRPARGGAPTVVLYAHHDVQPADGAEWASPPFDPVVRDRRLYGRGSADDKAGIVAHLAALDILRERVPDPDLGVIVLIEAEEEEGSPTLAEVLGHIDPAVHAAAVVIADSENRSETIPSLVVSLRGQINLLLTVSTLKQAQHAGAGGGGFPDAMIPMARLLASFHDSDGAVAIAGLDDGGEPASGPDESEHRESMEVLDGVTGIGTASLGARLWRRPSVTVTGMDVVHPDSAPTVLLPSVTAKVTIRLAPGQSIDRAREVIQAHIAANTAFGAHVEVGDGGYSRGFLTETSHPVARLMSEALAEGWGAPPEEIGSGASAAVVAMLADRFEAAAVLLTGVLDPASRPHGVDESVSLDVLQKAIAAEALFLVRMNQEGSI